MQRNPNSFSLWPRVHVGRLVDCHEGKMNEVGRSFEGLGLQAFGEVGKLFMEFCFLSENLKYKPLENMRHVFHD